MLLRWNGEEPVNIGQWELYAEKAGEGTTSYQDYDRKITRQAVRWLRDRAAEPGQRPWALKVSYVSAHPPFSVPRRLLDLYDVSRIPLPPAFSPDKRPEHPALRHFRRIFAYRDLTDTAMLRRIAAAYYALCTHLDEQIGEVLATLVVLGLTGDTRVIYTSDHGEALGAHGLFGKFQLFDPSACVPLIMAGPDVPESRVVTAPVSHVDLFPTIIESFGLSVQAPPPHGRSLWRTLETGKRDAPVFAEYHAAGSPAGMFMLRTEREKLIYHVGAPAQVYDMAADPQETRELGGTPAGDALAARLEAELRGICDPESVDRQAKADQMAKAEFWGGNEAIRKEGLLVYTPAPGEKPEIEGGAPS
jgi:choline-sulfatase